VLTLAALVLQIAAKLATAAERKGSGLDVDS